MWQEAERDENNVAIYPSSSELSADGLSVLLKRWLCKASRGIVSLAMRVRLCSYEKICSTRYSHIGETNNFYLAIFTDVRSTAQLPLSQGSLTA